MIDNTKTDREIVDEARIGARWWANCLRNPDSVTHDAGDLMVNAMTSWARDADSRNDEFPPEKVDRFEEALIPKIQDRIDDQPWDPQQPFMRNTAIRCDYHADPILQEAADDVGLEISSMTTFPIKTTMYIDPGEVRVAGGHGNDPETIWESGEYLTAIREYTEDWVWSVEHPDHGTEYDYEPKVFPVGEDGYIVRAYGEYNADCYGPESKDFQISTDEIESEGLETVLSRLKDDVDEWRHGEA